MRQRRERADDRQFAHVALAEISLQPPDRDKNLPRHAELRLDARQQRRVALQHRPPAIDAPGADAGRDILLEGFVEGVALAAVEIQHRLTRNAATPTPLSEIPAACASAEMLATNEPKSPPQRAAWEGVARVRRTQ